MELTDKQKELQPLLQDFGVIIMPDEIDHQAYIDLSWALYAGRREHPDQTLELRCCGIGGEAFRSFAVGDLIRADGNVRGVAIGRISSGHSVVWASCPERIAYPNAVVSVHQTREGGWITGYREKDFELAHEHTQWINEHMIRLYASISNQDEAYWRKVIFDGGYELVDFDRDKLVELEMVTG